MILERNKERTSKKTKRKKQQEWFSWFPGVKEIIIQMWKFNLRMRKRMSESLKLVTNE